MSNFHDVSSPDHLKEVLSADLNRVSLLSFWAEWAEPCKQMNIVVKELANKYPDTLFLSIEAESQPDIAESFDIESVPSLILLQGHTLLTRISGADSAALTAALAAHGRKGPKALSKTNQSPAAAPSNVDVVFNEKAPRIETPEELTQRLRALMNMDNAVLFMKGSPEKPQCGFSRQFVGILKDHNVRYAHFNILSDESVRQGLKVLNNWPTFPQFVVKGEFVGGLDIIKDMIENDEFDDVVADVRV